MATQQNNKNFAPVDSANRLTFEIHQMHLDGPSTQILDFDQLDSSRGGRGRGRGNTYARGNNGFVRGNRGGSNDESFGRSPRGRGSPRGNPRGSFRGRGGFSNSGDNSTSAPGPMPHISQSFVKAANNASLMPQTLDPSNTSQTKPLIAPLNRSQPKPKPKSLVDPFNSSNLTQRQPIAFLEDCIISAQQANEIIINHNVSLKMNYTSGPKVVSAKYRGGQNVPYIPNKYDYQNTANNDNGLVAGMNSLNINEPAFRVLKNSIAPKPQSFSNPRFSDSPGTPRRQYTQNTRPSSRREVYTPHISKAQAQAGLKSGTLLQGKLRINKRNRHDAYVSLDSLADVFVPGMKSQNRALDGDTVLISLLTDTDLEREMKRVGDKRAENIQSSKERQRKCELVAQESESDTEMEESRTFGQVVFIVDSVSYKRSHVGTIQMDRPGAQQQAGSTPGKSDARNIWFKPSDKRVPFILLPKETAPKEFLHDPTAFSNMLVTCTIKRWNDDSLFPFGIYGGVLGQMGQLPVESEAILVANGITWDTFSDEPWCIPQSEIDARVDLRKERIFSIDPSTARDLDDAVSVKTLDGGLFEIGVHIADVSHFVKENTVLDTAALERATSVYLVQKVIPMLPRLLCEELCSLNPDVDRLSFSVFWIFDAEANCIGEPRFCKSVIRSCAKLSYNHAQAVIDGQGWDDLPVAEIGNGMNLEQVKDDILCLFKFSKIMRHRRFDNGSLTLNSIKLWFTLDEFGNPIDSGTYILKDANRLIEEALPYLIQKLASEFPEEALLRCHPAPLPKQLTDLAESLVPYGITLDTSSSKALNDSFEAIADPLQRNLLRLLSIKKMKRAEYYCTGSRDISQYYHFALGVPLSPIRRYCDLVVHRMLDLSIRKETIAYNTDQVTNIAKQCNSLKNASRDAQDASQDLYLCSYLSTLPKPVRAEAYVNKIGTRSVDVVVFQYGIEQTVWVEDVLEQAKGMNRGVEENEFGNGKNQVSASPKEKEFAKGMKQVSGGLEVHWNGGSVQRIAMFSKVEVGISVAMDMSPPSIKLTLLPPRSL